MIVDPLKVAPPAPTAEPEFGQPLLDAKFSAPQFSPDTVSRARLIEAARSSDRRVIAITAPAGYGKSTFLAEWAQAEDRRVACVSLDRFDDDPAVLLASVASAYVRVDPDSADLVADIRAGGASVLGRLAPRLAAALHASPVPFVLMLDDLHEVPSLACHDVLGVVISGVPCGSQLVAASRSEQPHLPRLRVLGEAMEFGAGDLALDAVGAQQIFSNAGVSLSSELAVALTHRTEGWPAGLYLTALIARDSEWQAPDVTGEDQYVADYLYHEALARQPEDVQRFLLRTAVLDQLSAPLCDVVLGSSGAAAQLRHLEAAGLFVVPLDRRRGWYRYHTLFREFLLGELDRTEPGFIMTLHERAADWYEANGNPALALEHLLLTTDWERSVRLAAELALPTYKAGKVTTNLRWYAAIGDANIERYPPLAVQRCWEAIYTGDAAEVQRWAAIVDDASFDEAPGDGSASFDSSRALLRAGLCASGPEPMMADAAIALDEEAAWSPFRSEALWLLGEAHLLAGNPDEARGLLVEASAAADAAGNTETIVVCESEVVLLAMDRGQWQPAAERLERPLAIIEKERLHDYVTCLLAFAAAARLSLHRGDLGEAHSQLIRAMRVRPSATWAMPFLAVRLRLQLAKVYLALADVATARQLMREIDDILMHRPALGTLADEVEGFRRILASTIAGATGRLPLTQAELRVLPYLQTHLVTSEIAERLFVSQHTVRSQMQSIYRKLGVSSRNEVVQAATAIGLLG